MGQGRRWTQYALGPSHGEPWSVNCTTESVPLGGKWAGGGAFCVLTSRGQSLWAAPGVGGLTPSPAK